MKTLKKTLWAAILSFLVLNTNAQLKVISNNNVGIGVDAPAEKLQINGSVRGNINGALRVSTGNGYIDIGPQNSTYAHLNTDRYYFAFNKGIIFNNDLWSPTTNFSLSCSSGGIYFNQYGLGIDKWPSYKLHVEGTACVIALIITSDQRLKENIQEYKSDLSNIRLLRPVKYNMKAPAKKAKQVVTPNINGTPQLGASSVPDSISLASKQTVPVEDEYYRRQHIGFLAQEVQKIYPELVYTDKKGYLSIDYVSMIPILVGAIKDQQQQIDQMKQEIVELKKGKK